MATSHIRITHEIILATTRTIAGERRQGVASTPRGIKNTDRTKDLERPAPVVQRLVIGKSVLNENVTAAVAMAVCKDQPNLMILSVVRDGAGFVAPTAFTLSPHGVRAVVLSVVGWWGPGHPTNLTALGVIRTITFGG